MKPDPSVELFYDAAWHELGDWRVNSGIEMNRGRRDEASDTDPASGSLVLNNRHGNYSPRNPLSTLYGKIGRNTPLRVLEGTDVRFSGEVSAWPSRWDLADADVWVPIEASGILRRLNQGQKALRSALFRDLSTRGPTLVAYWPMEEEKEATQFASGIGQGAATFGGPIDLAAYDELVSSDHLPTFSDAGAQVSALIPSYTPATKQRLLFFIHVPSDGVASETPLITAHVDGTLVAWRIFLRPDGGLRLQAYSDVGGTLALDSVMGFALNGKPGLLTLRLDQDGADIDWNLTILHADGTGGTVTGTITTDTHNRFYAVSIDTSGDGLNGTALGHIAVVNDASITVIWDIVTNSFRGWAGETAANRMIRLCADEGVPLTVVGDPDETELVGAQEIDELLEILKSAANVDMGFLGESLDTLGLVYRTRSTFYSQDPALTLDYSDGEIFEPITPTEDDKDIRNEVTVKRLRGSSETARLESGSLSVQPPPAGIGLYDTTVDLNLASDDQLHNQTAWRLHLGTLDELRVPSLTLNLANPRMEAHLAAIAAIREGDRIVIENMPAWLPPGPLDLIVQGWKEYLGEFERSITFNCTPGSAWLVGILEDAELGRLDTAGSTLNASATSSATSLSVATTTGPLWTTTGAEFPFDILIGGEIMTVTAISGATSPQTFTVVRAVNGIVKAHAAGESVALAYPARIAL